MAAEIGLSKAKTHLSSLVERAAAGEEVVITKNGKPRAKLVPIPAIREQRQPAGAMGLVEFDEEAFDAPDPELEALFYDSDIEPGLSTHSAA